MVYKHLLDKQWPTTMGMVDCNDWTEELRLGQPPELPESEQFQTWFNLWHMHWEDSPEPLGHRLEEQRTVILGVIDYMGKGRTQEDFCIPDVLGCLEQLSYPQILMEFHTARIQREGQHLLFNGTDIPIMRVPTPPPVDQRAVNPNEIPAILLNDPLIRDPHLLDALFEFCTGIGNPEVPRMNRPLFECYAASDERWKLIYDLQVTVCLLDSRHGFPDPQTWRELQEGSDE